MVRTTRDQQDLEQLEEWVNTDPADMAATRQQRRRAAAAALGVQVVQP